MFKFHKWNIILIFFTSLMLFSEEISIFYERNTKESITVDISKYSIYHPNKFFLGLKKDEAIIPIYKITGNNNFIPIELDLLEKKGELTFSSKENLISSKNYLYDIDISTGNPLEIKLNIKKNDILYEGPIVILDLNYNHEYGEVKFQDTIKKLYDSKVNENCLFYLNLLPKDKTVFQKLGIRRVYNDFIKMVFSDLSVLNSYSYLSGENIEDYLKLSPDIKESDAVNYYLIEKLDSFEKCKKIMDYNLEINNKINYDKFYYDKLIARLQKFMKNHLKTEKIIYISFYRPEITIDQNNISFVYLDNLFYNFEDSKTIAAKILEKIELYSTE